MNFMSVRQKVIFNTFIQFINRFILSGSAFLVSLFIARFFGPRGFGEYSKATTFIALFYLFSDFGLNAYTLRQISQEPQNEKKIINNLFGLRIVISLILILIVVFITLFLPYDAIRNEGFTPVAKKAIIVLSLLILYQSFLTTTNVIFQKHLRYELSTLANLVGSFITVITVFLLLLLKQSLPTILLGYSCGSVVSTIILFFLVKKLYGHFTTSFSLTESKKLIFNSLPLGLTLVFNLVYFRADVFILTLFRTTNEVGAYGLAYKFFEFPLTLPTFFANSLYPILLQRSQNKKLFKETVLKAAIFLLALSLFTLFSFYLFAPFLKFIREDFYPSISILRLLSLSMPVFFLSSLFMWILITFGKNKELLLIYFFGMIINLLLNLIFIPSFGTTAAALITLLSEFIIMVINGWFSFKLVMLR